MPTYEYRCNDESCAHEFELFQSIKSEPVAPCPTCQKPARRLISAGAGILFKGSGFYTTDYRSKSYGEDSKVDKLKKAEKETPKSGASSPKTPTTPAKSTAGASSSN